MTPLLPVLCLYCGEGATRVVAVGCMHRSQQDRGALSTCLGAGVLQRHTHTGFLTFGGILRHPLDTPGPLVSALSPTIPCVLYELFASFLKETTSMRQFCG